MNYNYDRGFMKKICLFIILLLLITGCDNVKTVSKTDDKSNKICNQNYNDEDDTLASNLSEIDGFNCDYLTKYLDYKKENSSAKNEDIIYLVNLGINNTYSSYLMSIVKAKYFIVGNLDKYLDNKKDSVDETISYVNAGLYRTYYTEMEATDLTQDTSLIVNKYYYLNSDYVPDDLETLDSGYSRGGNNKLRSVAKEAFEKMVDAAKLENIIIYNLSAYRSYETQKNIHDRSIANYGVEESDKSSARPGNSEHQTGLALDVNNISEDFKYSDEYEWLSKNAYKYGFILRYPEDKVELTGYSYEPWHYRYVGEDIAKTIKEEGITFEEYYAYYINN